MQVFALYASYHRFPSAISSLLLHYYYTTTALYASYHPSLGDQQPMRMHNGAARDR